IEPFRVQFSVATFRRGITGQRPPSWLHRGYDPSSARPVRYGEPFRYIGPDVHYLDRIHDAAMKEAVDL
ncbi:MAG: hypothetical protein ACLQVL_00215, partial [Terriglobia bacterium]